MARKTTLKRSYQNGERKIMADASQIFSALLPDASVLIWLLLAVVVAPIIGFFVWLFITADTRPIKYKGVALELIGDTIQRKGIKVIYKRKKGEEGYYVNKKKIFLSKKYGVIDHKGKTAFYLFKDGDKYAPILLGDKLLLLDQYEDDTGKTIKKKVKLANFGAELNLKEFELAVIESIEHDARKYRNSELLERLFLFGVPMIVLLIAFFLLSMSFKKSAEINELQVQVVETNNRIMGSVASIAENIGILVNKGAVIPPPG